MSSLSLSIDLNTGSLIVVSPLLLLLVSSLILSTELLLHWFTPWLRLRLTTTHEQRTALKLHTSRIASLRIQSNQLNSPATFAEYAKVQRALQKELKALAVLQQMIGGGGGGGESVGPASMIHTAQQFAIGHGIRAIVYLICFIVCYGRTLFILPTHGWMTMLSYTPVRLVLGEVGIIPWIAICSTVSTAIKTWL